jgi:hypothetical protein
MMSSSLYSLLSSYEFQHFSIVFLQLFSAEVFQDESEIVYFCQMSVVYVIIVTSIVNLSLQNGKNELWITLLSRISLSNEMNAVDSAGIAVFR